MYVLRLIFLELKICKKRNVGKFTTIISLIGKQLKSSISITIAPLNVCLNKVIGAKTLKLLKNSTKLFSRSETVVLSQNQTEKIKQKSE